ncbi:MAG TPA: hypothetical protein VM778_13085 [Gemmatimonadota bacterium]|nr:hypothetical protein [Gemmatimonadota bacterium]
MTDEPTEPTEPTEPLREHVEMSDRPASRARRAAGELAIIVVGVLIALWIDAGWAWLQDRRDESALIEDLRSDFEANRSALEQVHVEQQRAADVTRQVLVVGVDGLPADSVDALFQAMLDVQTFNPRTGALDSALGSGRIQLLRNPRLRSALAAWPGYLEDATEEVVESTPQLFTVGQAVAAGVARGRPSHELIGTILSDERLSGALALRMFAYYEVRSDTDALLAQTDSILTLLGTRP